jgi:probable F420-dependent oxidoreductase
LSSLDRPRLGSVGIWSRELRYGDAAEIPAAATALEEAGFGALWIPDVGGPVFEAVERLLAATERIVVATGILNVWMHQPADVAAAHARLDRVYPGRFLLGLGIGHARIVDEGHPGRYARPLTTMRCYLDELDALAPPRVRVLAALAPRMIALAAERASGVHPYLVPTGHVRLIREAVGPDALVAPAVSVVLDPDPAARRTIARTDLQGYLELPNYTRTWRRLGFDDADFADGGSEELLDALYVTGTRDEIADRISDYRAAGADHVCLRVVTGEDGRLPQREWQELAAFVP